MIYVIDTASCIGALRRAKEYLDEGWQRYICLALADIVEEDPSLTEACHIVVDYVSTRCMPFEYGNSNFEDWLDVELQRTDNLSLHTYTMCRMAWIDKMIETLRVDGCLP